MGKALEKNLFHRFCSLEEIPYHELEEKIRELEEAILSHQYDAKQVISLDPKNGEIWTKNGESLCVTKKDPSEVKKILSLCKERGGLLSIKIAIDARNRA